MKLPSFATATIFPRDAKAINLLADMCTKTKYGTLHIHAPSKHMQTFRGTSPGPEVELYIHDASTVRRYFFGGYV